MDKIPRFILRKNYIADSIRRKLKYYNSNILSLQHEIDVTISGIEPIEIGGKEVYPDYILIGRSSTDKRKIKFVQNIMQTPLNKLINEYNLKNNDSFENFIENILPYMPIDRDYVISTETDLTQKEIEIVTKYWQNNSKVITNKPYAEFTVETTKSWKKILKSFPYKRPQRNHVKDLPFNSVLIYKSKNSNPEVDKLLENMRLETGNPRTYDEFKIELKDFQEKYKTSSWF